MQKRALTIIELVIVVTIIGILAVTVTPFVENYFEPLHAKNTQSIRQSFETSLKDYQYRYLTTRESIEAKNLLGQTQTLVFSASTGGDITKMKIIFPSINSSASCATLLNLFSNIKNEDITNFWSVNVSTYSYSQGGIDTDEYSCQFQYNNSGDSFTYCNGDGSVQNEPSNCPAS